MKLYGTRLEQYLTKVAGDLFRGVSQAYGLMHQEEPGICPCPTLDGLLSLDVVQVKVTDP